MTPTDLLDMLAQQLVQFEKQYHMEANLEGLFALVEDDHSALSWFLACYEDALDTEKEREQFALIIKASYGETNEETNY